MEILRYVSGKLILLAIACSVVASPLIQAQEAASKSGSAGSSDNARLFVSRAAKFGILESVNVFVDGVQVAELSLVRVTTRYCLPGSMSCR